MRPYPMIVEDESAKESANFSGSQGYYVWEAADGQEAWTSLGGIRGFYPYT